MSSITGVAAGDTVYISGGSSTKTYIQNTFTPKNGTDGSRITYSIGQESGHNGTAIFDGENALSYWIFGETGNPNIPRNFTITGNYGGANKIVVTNYTNFNIILDESLNIKIDHVTINGGTRWNPGTNIWMNCVTQKVQAYVSSANVWSVVNRAGEAQSYTNNVIENSEILRSSNTNTPSWGSDGLTGGCCTTFRSNRVAAWWYLDDTEIETGRHMDAWQNFGSPFVAIYGNSFENGANYEIFWEMIGVGGTNLLIYNNRFWQNHTASLASNLSVAIVIGQRTPASFISNIVVANNTIVDFYGRGAISIGDDPSETNTWQNIVVANNLAVNCGRIGSADAFSVTRSDLATNGITILNNKAIAGARGTNSFNIAQMQTAGGGSTVSFRSYAEVSPANNFRLNSRDAGATGLGVNLSAYFTTDADGVEWAGSWGLGAWKNVEMAHNTPRTQPLRILFRQK